jgi:hypothetical protein
VTEIINVRRWADPHSLVAADLLRERYHRLQGLQVRARELIASLPERPQDWRTEKVR